MRRAPPPARPPPRPPGRAQGRCARPAARAPRRAAAPSSRSPWRAQGAAPWFRPAADVASVAAPRHQAATRTQVRSAACTSCANSEAPSATRLETTFAASHAHRIRAVRASVYRHPTTLLACGMPVGVGLVRHRHGVEPRRPVHAVAGAQARAGRAGARVGSRRHGAVARHQRLRPRPEAERVGRRAAVGVHRRAVAARLRSPALPEVPLVM